MRIGFVVGRFPTLSETFVISQMVGLMKRGFEVGIVCEGITDYPHLDRSKEPLSVLLAHTHDWWGKFGNLRPKIDRLPAKIKDKVSAGLDTLSVRRLNDFDAVVAHFGQNGARVARLKKRVSIKPPIVTIFHGFDVGVPLRENGLKQYRDLFELGSLNLTVNQLFRHMLTEAGAPHDRTAVHHMGIDVTQIPFEWRSGEGSPLQLISVCRLIEKKGIEFSLRALGQLYASRSELDWRYTVVGDGPLLDNLRHLTNELGISNRVTFLGSLAHHDVKLWLARSHVFILPSVTASNGDLEGVPVALMEAMASGLTVLSTYHSGIPELIEDHETGFLAAERDVSALADKIGWIVEHPQVCRNIAHAARQKVEGEYNAETLNDQFAGLIAKLVRGSSAHLGL
ncbi:glycosyltransferase [Rhizobium sp. LEGMi12c]